MRGQRPNLLRNPIIREADQLPDRYSYRYSDCYSYCRSYHYPYCYSYCYPFSNSYRGYNESIILYEGSGFTNYYDDWESDESIIQYERAYIYKFKSYSCFHHSNSYFIE